MWVSLRVAYTLKPPSSQALRRKRRPSCSLVASSGMTNRSVSSNRKCGGSKLCARIAASFSSLPSLWQIRTASRFLSPRGGVGKGKNRKHVVGGEGLEPPPRALVLVRPGKFLGRPG